METQGRLEDETVLRERLNALAAFAPEFESPDFSFSFGKMVGNPGCMPYYQLSPVVAGFVDACYKTGWVQPFDWVEWKGTAEAARLRDDRTALEESTREQLGRLLTVLIRQDRFVEGALGSSYELGLLTGIVRRIAVLAAANGEYTD